uniref:Pectinesterase inhibitor domain-containing protein n=1 Tax=Cucumis sativus TaxID=3659 RepID=A0A0A0LDI5_CUCSA
MGSSRGVGAIAKAKKVAGLLGRLTNNKRMKGRNKAIQAVWRCFGAVIDEFHRQRNFDAQMGDLTTWVRAMLMDEDTCIRRFKGERGKVVNFLRNQG